MKKTVMTVMVNDEKALGLGVTGLLRGRLITRALHASGQASISASGEPLHF
jgi:hypothetical protein